MNGIEGIKKSVKAAVVANLFEADQPMIILLNRVVGKAVQNFIACPVPNEDGFLDYYFAVQVGRRYLIDYFDGQSDLRFLFTYAPGRKYFKCTEIPRDIGGVAQLEQFGGDVVEDMLPSPRFFATSHTSNYGVQNAVDGEQRIKIDGEWEMLDFGKFYQKFSDLYIYERAIEYVNKGENAQKIDEVYRAFSQKPFKGGSSYLNFFDDLLDVIPRQERPVLEGIEYHSPGWVELRGKNEILASVQDSVNAFLQHSEMIQKAHDDLRSYMTKEKMLAVVGGARNFDGDQLARLALLSRKFFEVLPVSGKDELTILTQGRPVVLAKVGLALFRRLKATAMFFAQGRLSYD